MRPRSSFHPEEDSAGGTGSCCLGWRVEGLREGGLLLSKSPGSPFLGKAHAGAEVYTGPGSRGA